MVGLTRLRFVLALWVVLFHYFQDNILADPSSPAVLETFAREGVAAVPFFFVLSGFVLSAAYPFERMAPHGATTDFAWRRFARLYPSFLASILVFASLKVGAAWAGIPNEFDLAGSWWQLPLVVVGLHAWNAEAACTWNCPTWSLSVEFLFYALFPALVRLPKWGKAAVWVLALALAVTPFGHLLPGIDGRHPLPNLVSFVTGMLLWDSGLARRPLARRIGAVLAVPAALALLFPGVMREGPAAVAWAAHLLWLAPWAAAVPMVLALSAPKDHDAMPWWTRLGDASYALYLWHVPFHLMASGVLHVLGVVQETTMVELLLYVPAAVLFSVAVFLWLEQPAERWLLARPAFRRRRQPVPQPRVQPDGFSR